MSEQRSSNPITTIVSFVAALAIIGGLVFAVVKGVQENPTLVGTLATALATVLAVVVGRERETRLQLRQKHREDIAPMYRELVDRLRQASADPEEASEFFQKWWTQLILDAPSEVIRAWLVWSRSLSDFDPTRINPRDFAATENVLRAIRKDLGHSDTNLKFGDLQRIFLQAPLADFIFGTFPHQLPRELRDQPVEIPDHLK